MPVVTVSTTHNPIRQNESRLISMGYLLKHRKILTTLYWLIKLRICCLSVPSDRHEVKAALLPPHFYGQLVQKKSGYKLLQKTVKWFCVHETKKTMKRLEFFGLKITTFFLLCKSSFWDIKTINLNLYSDLITLFSEAWKGKQRGSVQIPTRTTEWNLFSAIPGANIHHAL